MNLQTTAEQHGLVQGQKISLTHTSGPHNGETFDGALSVDFEIGHPVVTDEWDEITSEIKEIIHEEENDFSLTAVNGNTYALTKKVSMEVPREKSTVCF